MEEFCPDTFQKLRFSALWVVDINSRGVDVVIGEIMMIECLS